MAELGLERHPTVSHSELTAGHDVTNLLSHINQNFKQSKADQILRLLQDQDKHIDKDEDDVELIQEYDTIREEKVICDSDTLTDSVSDVEERLDGDFKETEVENNNIYTMNGHANNVDRGEEIKGYRSNRSRTSMGFHNNDGGEETVQESVIDTRDISVRPKSSYVRRHQLKKCFETETITANNDYDSVEPQTQRITKSARPKSRLGRASVPRAERKIVMVEAELVVQPEPVVPVKEDIARGGANNMYDRFSSTRQAKRESKRENKKAKAFCDYDIVPQQTCENMSICSSGNSMDTREEVTEVQPIIPPQNVPMVSNVNHVSSVVTGRDINHVSNSGQNTIPRNQTVQPQQHIPHHRRTVVHARPELSPAYHHPSQSGDPRLMRSDTIAGNAPMRASERRDAGQSVGLSRNSSNLIYRPKNPEPVTSRPIERNDIRPTTRTRRLQRRYMSQAQPHMTNVRPTSESVILARQKTEKNLMKKQAENRPHSEKILVNSQKNILSVCENPTQGPQTYVSSKGGVTQASHVQSGGFRGYDPGCRLKSSVQARDLPSDLTLPRQGQMVGSRKPLTLMKLPPLEASLAAKKKERGLTLAQRETCV